MLLPHQPIVKEDIQKVLGRISQDLWKKLEGFVKREEIIRRLKENLVK